MVVHICEFGDRSEWSIDEIQSVYVWSGCAKARETKLSETELSSFEAIHIEALPDMVLLPRPVDFDQWPLCTIPELTISYPDIIIPS